MILRFLTEKDLHQVQVTKPNVHLLIFLINKKSLLNKLDKDSNFMGCFVKGFDNLDIYSTSQNP
ncbi:hypothetical protein KHM19_13280 [Leptospira borgpetersenii]|uniref:Uncharacterized protein n=5 Tax=Leptospira borgpetersenii TaxID=174 RepID=M3HS65_LEPBO|nr:hypothetical protein LBBP_03444 [Leptospira borgpetersenii serovar Ballum]AXX14937.1 hypothetical protein C4Q31_04655 [Leptospira borgpetersenii serovar Ceylonica]EKP14829.1 hypothetical protein LEP1GSC128_1783 [Leptospira borgpetersenii str. 200801926]EKQ92721.1 hypothetical protein LEP1GSC101_2573 [Leptospira borgpetersenii str. UI 09149]EKQ99753.1 hypothetical protein LEP1GSC121_1869 [Leptospira borgpetersenii serovar Castellonis str. 200801910]EMG00455.1 hypothetical protein LEP1GSC123_